MSQFDTIRRQKSTYLIALCMVVLLVSATAQAAHFCGFNASRTAVQGLGEEAQDGSNRSTCAICVASHQATATAAAPSIQLFDLQQSAAVIMATSRLTDGLTLLPDVRPPPAS